MGILGFDVNSSSNSGGDFTPIVKYDARSGRIFRIDRKQDSDGGFYNDLIDITPNFKAVFDFETVQTGWMLFAPNQAPSLQLVPLAVPPNSQAPLPDRPSPQHKNGTRTLIKLNKSCGGDRPKREIAGTSNAYVGAYEKLFTQYVQEKSKHPGKLPVVTLVTTTPIESSNGKVKSTNYTPVWQITDWVPRPEDMPLEVTPPSMAPVRPLPAVPPATGHLPPSKAGQPAVNLDDDFG